MLDHELCGLPCRTVEADEPLSKLVVAHAVGKRDAETTRAFIRQLRARIPWRLELFTDGFYEYPPVVDDIYGADVDYAQVIKPRPGGLVIERVFGDPAAARIGTSFVERHNGTIRQQIRRFTRKTLAFSKKLRNLAGCGRALRGVVRLREAARVTARGDTGDGPGDLRLVWPLDRLLP